MHELASISVRAPSAVREIPANLVVLRPGPLALPTALALALPVRAGAILPTRATILPTRAIVAALLLPIYVARDAVGVGDLRGVDTYESRGVTFVGQ